MQQNLNQEIIEKKKKLSSQNIKYLLISLAALLLISVITIIVLTYNVINYEYIHRGIYINGTYVGEQSKESVLSDLEKKYGNISKNGNITLIAKGETDTILYQDLNLKYNIEDAVNKAFSVGREGNIFNRVFDVFNKRKTNEVITLNVLLDEERLDNRIKSFSDKIDIPVKEIRYELNDDTLILVNGTQGEITDMEETKEKILNFIKKGQQGNFNIEQKIIEPKPLDIEKLYSEVFTLPSDARYEVKNYKLNIIPHVIGVDFDKEQAKKIKEESPLQWNEIKIPVTLSYPKVLTKELENSLFNNKLASYTTYFNANYKERSHNITLAARKLDNIVLAPGDEISFNEIVGKRSSEAGYQNAKVYMGNKIVEGIGGGICQVSTTLYNTVLLSDLEVIFRSNHSMTVSYVPLGQDAAVEYGTLDFKFKNNKKNPIKIKSEVNNGKIRFEILGTQEEDNRIVVIENIVIKQEPFPIKETENPNLAKGEVIIQQNGANGYVVDTYKIIKQNNEVVSRDKISRSIYRPIEQIQVIGTKEIPPEEEMSEQESFEEGFLEIETINKQQEENLSEENFQEKENDSKESD